MPSKRLKSTALKYFSREGVGICRPLKFKNLKPNKYQNGKCAKTGQQHSPLTGLIPKTTLAAQLHSVGLFHENE